MKGCIAQVEKEAKLAKMKKGSQGNEARQTQWVFTHEIKISSPTVQLNQVVTAFYFSASLFSIMY